MEKDLRNSTHERSPGTAEGAPVAAGTCRGLGAPCGARMPSMERDLSLGAKPQRSSLRLWLFLIESILYNIPPNLIEIIKAPSFGSSTDRPV